MRRWKQRETVCYGFVITDMSVQFLLPETIIEEAGSGPALKVDATQSPAFQLTLGITRIVEQQSLELSIWGSSDQEEWGAMPLTSFQQKFYCGTYSLFLDLSQHPDVKYIRAQWKVGRWGRGSLKPMFGVYVAIQPAAVAAHS